jgi:hypothetical protein
MSMHILDESSYKIELTDSAVTAYDDEIMYSGWIPDMALQQSQNYKNEASIPVRLVSVEVEVFLRKMYASQR